MTQGIGVTPALPDIYLEPFWLVPGPSYTRMHGVNEFLGTGQAPLLTSHSPSHEAGHDFISLYSVEPGGAHPVVNWSFSIYKDEQAAGLMMLGTVPLPSPALTPSEVSPSSMTSVVPWRALDPCL